MTDKSNTEAVAHPRPPKGVTVEQLPADSADYLDGLDEIESKYPEGTFTDGPDAE